MKPNRIFRWVWRINALLILAGGITIVSVLAVAFYPNVKDYFMRRPIYHAGDMVNVEDVDIDSEWTLGGFQQIRNTSFLISPVYSKQEYSVGSIGSGKSASATRNYLVLNSTDKSTKWVASTNKYLFLSNSEIHESTDAASKVIGLRFSVVQEDSNNDGRLTGEDVACLAISDLDGSNFTPVVTGINAFLGEQQPEPDILLVFYRSGGKNYLAEVKISAKKVIETKELPKING